MSIIHDALKKVQEKTPHHDQGVAAGPLDDLSGPDSSWQSPSATKPAAPLPRRFIVLGVVLTIVVVVILVVLIRLAQKTTAHPVHAAASPAVQAAAPKTSLIDAIKSAVAGPSAPATLTPIPGASSVNVSTKAQNPAPEAGALHLEGIMVMNGKKVALLDGEVYEEGQAVDGKIIAEIAPDSITVMDNGTKKIIPLKKK